MWQNLAGIPFSALEQKIACKSPTSQKHESGLFEDISFLITLVEAVPLCVIKYSLLYKFESDSLFQGMPKLLGYSH